MDTNSKIKKFKSGIDINQREMLRGEFNQFIKLLAKKTGVSAESIVLEMRYWHQSPTNVYRTTASQKDKKQSWTINGKRCCGQNLRCSYKDFLPFEKAVFHHLQRCIENQHGPDNLKPFCENCHNLIEQGEDYKTSLHKGSR